MNFLAARSRQCMVLSVFLALSFCAGMAGAVEISTVTVAPAAVLNTGDVVVGAMSQTASIRVVMGLKLRNKASLDAFVAQLGNKHAAKPQAVLNQAQIQVDYLPTTDQTDAVVKFLSNAGFTDIEVASNRMLVSATGSTVEVETAFRTSMIQVRTKAGRLAYANSTAIQIPASLQGIVLSVQGLQTVHIAHTMSRPSSGLRTHRNASPMAITGHNPVDFPAIYGADGSVPTAAGINIGIVTSGNLTGILTDLNTFTTNNGLSAVTTQVINVNGTATSTDGDGEWAMDSQSIVGMAGGEVGTLLFYNMKSMAISSLTIAFNRIVSDNQTKIINVSLGLCETQMPSNDLQQEDQSFQLAVAQGQTFSVSSGDRGSDECKDNSDAPSWPASSQYVMALGGTRLNTTGTTWNGETTWDGTGGSPSSFEPMPTWQQNVGANSGHTTRGVPDVAYTADPSSGALVIVGGSTQQIGGTSLSAPLFAGMWARVMAAGGTDIGFAAPLIYQLPATDFHDVTSGSNGGYSAATGWDYTTGFGSVIVALAVADLGAAHAPTLSLQFAPGSIAPDGISTLTITLSNASQPGAATLNAALTDTLPTGVLVAPTPNASTTCSGGTGVTAIPGGSTINLAASAVIPASSTCAIIVDVTAAGTGTYTNVIAAGVLQTDLGNSEQPAQATLKVGNGLSDPLISIAPGSLSFTLAAGTNASQSLTLANAGGGTLNYTIAEANATAALTPHDAYNFQLDDGSSEGADGLTDENSSNEYESIWLNRYSVAGPLTLNSISIYWPAQDSGKSLVGKQPNLIVYYDADGDGDPSNAVRLGGDNIVSIAQNDALQTYPVSIPVPGAGDLYIGFADAWASGGTAPALLPAAVDSDNPQGQSLLIYNGDGSTPNLLDLSQNGSSATLNYNLMIRASGTSSYDSTQCASTQDVAWLSETPTSGAVLGGHSDSVSVTADATSLVDGNYSALLCVTSNDAGHGLVQVPVTLTVGAGGGNQPPVANFVYAPSGLNVNFTDTSSDSDGSVVSWLWDFGDGDTSTSQNPSHTFAAYATYTVTLTVTDDGTATGSHTTQVIVPAGTPAATVTPNVLSYALRTGEQGTRTLNIANAGNADLNYSIAQAAPQQVVLGIARKRKLADGVVYVQSVNASASAIAIPAPLLQAAAAPVRINSDLSFILDGGTYDHVLGFGDTGADTQYAAIFLNRFTPASGTGAFTIDSISVLWPTQTTDTVVGKSARILAYYDADGDGNPGNATLLGQSTVTIAGLEAVETYNVSFDVPGAGDIYVGFEDQWAEAGYTPKLNPGAFDETTTHTSSYLLGKTTGDAPDYTHLANNDFGGTVNSHGLEGDFLIRATGTLSGGPTADCNNPSSVPWLTETPASGAVATGTNTDVSIGFNASGMAPGEYTALLCISTDDPHNAMIEVPVSLSVSACLQPGGDDTVFTDGFDGDSGCIAGDNLISGNLDKAVTKTADGIALNLVTGAYHPYTGTITDDDINLYRNGGKLTVYWYGDQTTLSVGGVADEAGEFKVLHSGDVVGPSQTFSAASQTMTNWLTGVDGYIGIAFDNEDTGLLNYGYIHLTTSSPKGFPAQVLEYVYDKSGAAVPIP